MSYTYGQKIDIILQATNSVREYRCHTKAEILIKLSDEAVLAEEPDTEYAPESTETTRK